MKAADAASSCSPVSRGHKGLTGVKKATMNPVGEMAQAANEGAYAHGRVGSPANPVSRV